MEHVCSSTQEQCLFIDPNIDNLHEVLNYSNHEQQPPLFLDVSPPFFDATSIIPTHTNNHTNLYSFSPPKPENIIDTPSPLGSKRLTKRSGGKKDRHSKIHTAQGLRDRRMRLSLHIARKFFDLQDLLGFDKASKTIEWLFCKSNKAIKEVAESFSPQHTNQSMIFQDNFENNMEISKDEEIKNTNTNSNTELRMKRVTNNSSVRETRDKARARARDRTKERLMVKELEKSKKLYGGNPKEEISKLGLSGCLTNPNNHNAEEISKLGLITSSPSEPIQQEHSSSSTINLNSFENYSGNVNVGTSTISCSTLINHNPPAGWLNSMNGFWADEYWDADTFVNEYYNYGVVPTTFSLTAGDIYEQNPSSFFMSSNMTNIVHVQSENQGK